VKRSLGVDLAGSEKRKTGICILNENLYARTFIIFSDKELLSVIKKVKPDIVAIDAPLSIPKGRKDIDDKRGPHFRECDLMLRKLGIRFFPVTLGPMRILTKRGISLKNRIEKMGYKVIEVFPGGAQDVLGIPRKTKGLRKLREGLTMLGIKGIKKDASGDELDAITAAYVGLLYLKGKVTLLKGIDGCIVIPRTGNIQKGREESQVHS